MLNFNISNIQKPLQRQKSRGQTVSSLHQNLIEDIDEIEKTFRENDQNNHKIQHGSNCIVL